MTPSSLGQDKFGPVLLQRWDRSRESTRDIPEVNHCLTSHVALTKSLVETLPVSVVPSKAPFASCLDVKINPWCTLPTTRKFS